MSKAVEAVFAQSIRMRCWFHRLANIRAKLPDHGAAELMAHLYAVRDAPVLDGARAAADRFSNTYSKASPAAVACSEDDREALLAIHRVPVRHRIRVRTTNLAERGFEEKHQGHLEADERAGHHEARPPTMIRAAEGWHRVSINDIEPHQLKLLRGELGIDSPPEQDHATKKRGATDCAAA